MPGQPQIFSDPEARPLRSPDMRGSQALSANEVDSNADPNPDLNPDPNADQDNVTPRTVRRGTPVWLQRISLFVLVLFCVYLGVLVLVLPWWPRIWDHNMFIQARPALAAILHNGAVRGIISGLGLIDIWIGISEAVHYRDYRD
jgi:hypothetical protein